MQNLLYLTKLYFPKCFVSYIRRLLVIDLLELFAVFNVLKLHLSLLVLVHRLEVTQPPVASPPIRVLNLVALAKVHIRGLCETKVLGHLHQVQVTHIEYILHVVSFVGPNIRFERQLTGLVQKVVFRQQIFQLQLNIGDFTPREFELVQRYLCLFEVLQEFHFFGTKEQQCMAANVFTTGRTTDAMDVLLGVIWRVVLHNPINGRNIQTTSGHIRTQQDT